jgi:hypothetical protein
MSRRQNTLFTNQNELKKVGDSFNALKNSLPNIENQIERIQLQCNELDNVQTEIK